MFNPVVFATVAQRHGVSSEPPMRSSLLLPAILAAMACATSPSPAVEAGPVCPACEQATPCPDSPPCLESAPCPQRDPAQALAELEQTRALDRQLVDQLQRGLKQMEYVTDADVVIARDVGAVSASVKLTMCQDTPYRDLSEYARTKPMARFVAAGVAGLDVKNVFVALTEKPCKK